MDITIIIAKLKEEMKKLFATKEDVPTKTSDLINDNDFITNSDVSGKENISNTVTNWSNTPSNDNYPSEKLVKDSLDGLDSAITIGLSGKVDKVSGKGLSTNDFTTGFKQDVEDLTTYVEQYITPWDNQNFFAYGSSPLKFYRLGRVCNLRGEWRCNNAQSTSSPLKVFHNIPYAPSTDIVTLQAGQGKNTYKCKITSDGEMYVQDYGVDSTINLPAKTSFYVNIVWVYEW